MKKSMKKVIIASDSFKGSLSSSEVADAVSLAIKDMYPDCDICKIPVADGGEGSLDSIHEAINASECKVKAFDPLMRPVEGRYLLTEDHTAIVELASASGITLLRPEELNPCHTTTYGTGMTIAHAIENGCRKIILTLGGSATNDAGTGILSALGVRFKDSQGNTLRPEGSELANIQDIDTSGILPGTMQTHFILACDVSNPLYGPDGAAYVFARQKGADDRMIEQLDKGLRHFSEIIRQRFGRDISRIPGSGAAGGTAGGLMAMTDAEIISGAEMILKITHFEEKIKGADLVITGEGHIDSQTQNGKLPTVVAKKAVSSGIPVLAICGRYSLTDEEMASLPYRIAEVTPKDMPLAVAMQRSTAINNIVNTIKKSYKPTKASNA